MALDWNKVTSELWEPIQDTVLPCIVGLGWSDQFADECEGETIFELHDVQPKIASGCIFEFAGAWFFLTAGHVLENFERDRDKGRVQFRFELHHGVSPDAHTKTPIPFDEAKKFSEFRSSGLDYGLVPIPETVRSKLLAAGVRCVPTSIVARPDESFDGYMMIGFPSQEFEVTNVEDSPHRREVDVFIGMPSLPVEGLADEDIPEKYKEDNPFVGRIVSLRGRYSTGKTVELDSIAGMSGAPIIGFRFIDKGLTLRLVAVQSDWIKAKRIIAGSRVVYLVALLAHAIAQSEEGTNNKEGEQPAN